MPQSDSLIFKNAVSLIYLKDRDHDLHAHTIYIMIVRSTVESMTTMQKHASNTIRFEFC